MKSIILPSILLAFAAPSLASDVAPASPEKVSVSVYSVNPGQEPTLITNRVFPIAPASDNGVWSSTESAFVESVSAQKDGTVLINPGVVIESQGGPSPTLSFEREVGYIKACQIEDGLPSYTPGVSYEGLGGYAYKNQAGDVRVQLAYIVPTAPKSTFVGPNGCAVELNESAIVEWENGLAQLSLTPQRMVIAGQTLEIKVQAL